MNVVRWSIGVLLGSMLAGAAAAGDVPLSTDPFRKPELEALPVEVPADFEPEAAPVSELPELRGILRSPRATLVNLDGDLVPVGGRFERFVVVAVGERNAVLRQGAEQHVVSLDDVREKPDAKPYR